MELQEAIEKFKGDLASVKEDGKSQVEIANLEKYLDFLLENASISAEQRRLQHASDIEAYRATIAFQVENFKAVMEAGKEAINASIIINGGAVIALLAFMGNAVAKNSARYIALLSVPLLVFGLGVLCGAAAFGSRYISQFLYAHAPNRKPVIAGHIFNALSWLTTLSALLLFAWGVWTSYTNLIHS